jgi:DNA-directed RNA polymerase specialized sigma24 family protein
MADNCHAANIRIPTSELIKMNWPEIPDRQLVESCLEGIEDAWAELLRRFHRLILGVLAKTIRPWFQPIPTLLEDLRQDVLLKICTNDFRALRELEWRHEGALRGLLQVTASSVAQDYVRKSLAQSRDMRREEQLDEVVHDAPDAKDPAAAVQSRVLLEQLARCLGERIRGEANRTRDIAMFLLYYSHQVTAPDLARIYQMGVRKVENTVARIGRIATKHCL